MSSAREDLSRRQLLTTGAISAASVAVSPLLLPGIYVTGAEGRKPNQFRLWATGDSHVGTDLKRRRESLADALRLDGHTWRVLKADDPLTAELRLLCRDEIGLIEQRTTLIQQLKAALHEYYPIALRAFDDWTLRSTWAFVEAFPTPEALAKAGKRRWEKFLHTNKIYRPDTYQKRLDLFAQAQSFHGSQEQDQSGVPFSWSVVCQRGGVQYGEP